MKSVEAKSLASFTDSTTGVVNRAKHSDFLVAFRDCVEQKTPTDFKNKLQLFRQTYHKYGDLLAFLDREWLPYAEYFCRYSTNQFLNCGENTTSPIEGLHAQLKSYLVTSKIPVNDTFQRIVHYIDQQQILVRKRIDDEKLSRPVSLAHNFVFKDCLGTVASRALFHVRDEIDLLSKGTRFVCDHIIRTTHDIPCDCELKPFTNKLVSIDPSLFGPIWWLNPTEYPRQQSNPPDSHTTVPHVGEPQRREDMAKEQKTKGASTKAAETKEMRAIRLALKMKADKREREE
ncbi:hypothetical protein BLNAU_12412 [Blattamonas nauphoetae]|uniref:Uncharacterized protein n=1 Tax=Blattamonas nauphoetae TaxID=2049346 RepID=A0ABQ9XP61_9EUKA|nr:hypothetical protein BLNAU_12412 [Blattamonas nauphoetae]